MRHLVLAMKQDSFQYYCFDIRGGGSVFQAGMILVDSPGSIHWQSLMV